LSAVIITEEKERERFAKDLHDGLGPLLSTIKLYINELGDEETEPEEKKNFVNIDVSSLSPEEAIEKIFSIIDTLV
jgi:signal transduction histidine kinase